jgi:hypothetical protein
MYSEILWQAAADRSSSGAEATGATMFQFIRNLALHFHYNKNRFE